MVVPPRPTSLLLMGGRANAKVGSSLVTRGVLHRPVMAFFSPRADAFTPATSTQPTPSVSPVPKDNKPTGGFPLKSDVLWNLASIIIAVIFCLMYAIRAKIDAALIVASVIAVWSILQRQISNEVKLVLLDSKGDRVDQGFEKMEVFTAQRFDIVNQRFDTVNQRFDNMEVSAGQRFNIVNQRFDTVNQRFDNMEVSVGQRFNTLNQRFDKMEQMIFDIGKSITSLNIDKAYRNGWEQGKKDGQGPSAGISNE
ncbi:hypothetical protein Ndes2526B_g05208 [Nannochloris sp. 'desiccata']